MNNYQKLINKYQEYDKQYENGIISKEDYNKKLDSLILELKKIDEIFYKKLFMDFIKK